MPTWETPEFHDGSSQISKLGFGYSLLDRSRTFPFNSAIQKVPERDAVVVIDVFCMGLLLVICLYSLVQVHEV